ncbi:MAG: hypothetical protein JWM58_572 [Rhizobium sp.]|nr:hypothetical protein [Rhizobium sp.]
MLERAFRDMPDRVATLPRNDRGFPIPYFAEEVNGVRDFRVVSASRMAHAVRNELCWVCGGRLGKYKAFVIGPMCGINRTISDPPSHRDCAIFSARNCPFLSSPLARRRETGLPDAAQEAPGFGLKRNPGAVGVWVTLDYRPFRAPSGNQGILFRIGDPTEVLWFASGEPADRFAVVESVRTGLPSLIELAEAQGDGAIKALAACIDDFEKYLPEARL